VVECLRPIIYDWCTSLLANMKIQMTDCKQGRMRNFIFSSIYCSFFLERVSILSPRVDINPHELCDPAMSWWTDVMRRLGDGRVPTPYNDELFFWWCRQVIAIEDFPYGGIAYRGILTFLFQQVSPMVILVRNVFI